ncbi:hypothetical protein OAV88_02070 [bacterium]|nr:hypothetical protein [bacterium]
MNERNKLKDWYDRQSWVSLTFGGLSAASIVLTVGGYALRAGRLRATYKRVRPLYIDFSKNIEFNPTRGVSLMSLGQSAEKTSYFDIHRSIHHAAQDELVPGIVVNIGRSMNVRYYSLSRTNNNNKQNKNNRRAGHISASFEAHYNDSRKNPQRRKLFAFVNRLIILVRSFFPRLVTVSSCNLLELLICKVLHQDLCSFPTHSKGLE